MDTTSKTDVLIIKVIVFNTLYCLMLICRKNICLECLALKPKVFKEKESKK